MVTLRADELYVLVNKHARDGISKCEESDLFLGDLSESLEASVLAAEARMRTESVIVMLENHQNFSCSIVMSVELLSAFVFMHTLNKTPNECTGRIVSEAELLLFVQLFR